MVQGCTGGRRYLAVLGKRVSAGISNRLGVWSKNLLFSLHWVSLCRMLMPLMPPCLLSRHVSRWRTWRRGCKRRGAERGRGRMCSCTWKIYTSANTLAAKGGMLTGAETDEQALMNRRLPPIHPPHHRPPSSSTQVLERRHAARSHRGSRGASSQWVLALPI